MTAKANKSQKRTANRPASTPKSVPPSDYTQNPEMGFRPIPPPGYAEHEGQISLIMSHFLMRYLNAIYHSFNGDLALVIILGEIAHHNFSQTYSSAQRSSPTFQLSSKQALGWYDKLIPCNAYSLAAATGIPRETVRRKMDELVKRGWLEIRADGARILPAVGGHFLPDFNVQMLLELLEVSATLKEVLDPAKRPKSHLPK